MHNHPFSGRRMFIGAAAVATVALAATLGIVASNGGASPGPLPLSNAGLPVQASTFAPVAKSFMAGDPSSVRILGARHGLAFYVTTQDGTACYSAGDAAVGKSGRAVTDSLGCPSDFPTASKPVLDDSFVSMDPSSGAITVLRLSGLAADPVARVGVISTDGAVSYAPVINNVYDLTGLSVLARAIAAYDASGNTLYTIPLSPTG